MNGPVDLVINQNIHGPIVSAGLAYGQEQGVGLAYEPWGGSILIQGASTSYIAYSERRHIELDCTDSMTVEVCSSVEPA